MPTRIQIERWYRRYFERITRGDGYQPFGYDQVTMEINHPGFTATRNRLRQLWLAAH